MTAAQAPGHVDAWTLGALRRLKRRFRGDPQVYSALVALDGALVAASKRRVFADGTPVGHGGFVTVADFASLTGLSVRAIQLACQEGRLRSVKIAGSWIIDPAEPARWRGRQ